MVVSNFRDASPGRFMLNLCFIWAEQGRGNTSEQAIRAVSIQSWTSEAAPRSVDDRASANPVRVVLAFKSKFLQNVESDFS